MALPCRAWTYSADKLADDGPAIHSFGSREFAVCFPMEVPLTSPCKHLKCECPLHKLHRIFFEQALDVIISSDKQVICTNVDVTTFHLVVPDVLCRKHEYM